MTPPARPGQPTRPARPRRPPLPRPRGGEGAAPSTGAPDDAIRSRARPQVDDAPRVDGPRTDPVGSVAVTTYASRRRTPGLPVRPAVVSSRSAERFAERVSARRAVTRRHLAVGTAVVLAAAVLSWLLLMSPVLALEPRQVVVKDPGTVVTVADVLSVVDARAGTPLPRLDTVALRDAILEVPGVRSAKVMRNWPHGLTITLVSREPVAAIPDPAGGFVLRDADGVQVGRAATPPTGLPVVTIPATATDTKRTLTAVLGVLDALPADLRSQVAAVQAASQDTVGMDLRDGAHVVWGSADQTALKIAVLKALRAAPVSSHAKVFDVSAPTLPITR